MISGQLDKRITIERKSVTQDSNYGTEIITWVTFAANVPAQVQDSLPSKSESVSQGLAISANPSRVRMRWMPGIDSSMRVIVHGEPDRTCQIIAGPAELGRREGLELMIAEYSS